MIHDKRIILYCYVNQMDNYNYRLNFSLLPIGIAIKTVLSFKMYFNVIVNIGNNM